MYLSSYRRAVQRGCGAVVAALCILNMPPAEAAQKAARQTKPVTPSAGKAAPTPAPAAAKSKGGKLFAVVIGPGPSWKKGQPLKKSGNDRHWKYWQDLHNDGRIESAGPVGKDTGFALLHARDQKEANAVLAADPAIRAGQYRAVARPYDETIGD